MQSDLFNQEEGTLDFEAGDISASFLRHALSQSTISCDLETSGLDWKSERIGLVQIYAPGMDVAVFKPSQTKRPERLITLIQSNEVRKIFHHAMFDLRFMAHHWSVKPANIADTKIASKILLPERKSHSLAQLLEEYLRIHVDKSPQRSDWLSWDLSELQLNYAKADVIHLPALLDLLMNLLVKEARHELALGCFEHIPTRVRLEIGNFGDVFAY